MTPRINHSICLLPSTFCLFAMLLVGCAPQLSPIAAQQTAVAGGCWPYGVGQPLPPTPEATADVPVPLFPTCVPALGEPTATVAPSRTPSPIPQATAQVAGGLLGGAIEIGDQPGYASARVLAVHPNDSTAAVGWISWGANRLDDSRDGRVWVRVQSPSGEWGQLQTVNIRPVKKFFGGLGLAFTGDGVVHAVFGAGGIDGDSRLFWAASRDRGASWSDPVPIGVTGAAPEPPTPTATPLVTLGATATPPAVDPFTPQGDIDGGALALRADSSGGLHLLFLSAAGGYHLGYAYRAPDATTWRVTERLESGAQYGGQLALLALPDGRTRRFVLVKGDDGTKLTLYRSDDGQQWQGQRMQLGRFLPRETVVATSVLAVPRQAGDLVAVAWSQYAAGGIFAQVSLDGGATWGDEEQIAQHNAGGKLFDEAGKGLLAGFEPSLAYEATTDQLAASWVELDLGPRPIFGRTLFAVRSLDRYGRWLYAVTPTAQETPPQLSERGLRGALVGSPDGRTHWLLTLDERNEQYRVAARRVNLAALLDSDPS